MFCGEKATEKKISKIKFWIYKYLVKFSRKKLLKYNAYIWKADLYYRKRLNIIE